MASRTEDITIPVVVAAFVAQGGEEMIRNALATGGQMTIPEIETKIREQRNIPPDRKAIPGLLWHTLERITGFGSPIRKVDEFHYELESSPRRKMDTYETSSE